MKQCPNPPRSENRPFDIQLRCGNFICFSPLLLLSPVVTYSTMLSTLIMHTCPFLHFSLMFRVTHIFFTHTPLCLISIVKKGHVAALVAVFRRRGVIFGSLEDRLTFSHLLLTKVKYTFKTTAGANRRCD